MAASGSFFSYAVEKPKARHPQHGVINERLIKEAIDEERALVEGERAAAADAAGSSAAQMSAKDLEAQLERHPVWEDLTHDKLESLTLSFRSLAAVANLGSLRGLRTLRLDNNSIRTIEGLEELHGLTWLDLSFNDIEKIEGLGKLSRLADLSLANNRIAQIEGLDGCGSLEFLSLANNRIPKIGQVKTLRTLPRLRALTMMGNPACRSEDDYKSQLLMWLPRLEWLEFKAVTPAQHQAALDAEAQLPEGLVRQEKAQEEAARRTAAEGEVSAERASQGLHHLADLWPRMSGRKRGAFVNPGMADDDDEAGDEAAAADGEGAGAAEEEEEEEEDAAAARAEAEERERVLRLPGVRTKWAAYARTVQGIVDRGLDRAGAVARRIQGEMAAADAALDSVRATSALAASERLAAFLKGLKRLQRSLVAGASLKAERHSREAAAARASLNVEAGAEMPLTAAAAAAEIERFRAANDELRETLLVAELRSNEQCGEIISRFEVQHATLAGERSDAIDASLRDAENEEKQFAVEVRGIVLAMVERVSADQPISAERDALSLESIRDGETLSKFGVLATRARPDVHSEAGAARDRPERASDAAAAASASSSSSAEAGAGDSSDRVPVPAKDLCDDLAILLADKEMAESALNDAEAARMEQLLAVSDACKAWQKADKERVVVERRQAELRATRERCEEIAAVWEANREELDALRALDV